MVKQFMWVPLMLLFGFAVAFVFDRFVPVGWSPLVVAVIIVLLIAFASGFLYRLFTHKRPPGEQE
jgi:hypothetical protein